jgi:hypothetical protein
MTLALAGVLFLAPLWAWYIGAAWPPSLRDNALKTLGAASVVMVATACWPLAILWGLALWHWTDPDDAQQADLQPPIAGVLAIGTVAAIFLLTAQVPVAEIGWVRGAILAGGLGQIGVLAWQAAKLFQERHRGYTYHFWRDSLRGSMGNRVVTGGFLAFCFALAPAPLLPIFGLGVLATHSFTALGATAVALAIRFPGWALVWAPAALLAAGVCWHWRGHPRDSVRGRADIWWLVWHSWLEDTWRGRLLGHGHWTFSRRARWWHSQGLVRDIYSHAHQDALQALIEYGAVGVLALGAWLALLTRGMAVGDPWTAALAAGLVVGMNQFTLHLPHTGLPVVAAAGVLWGRGG